MYLLHAALTVLSSGKKNLLRQSLQWAKGKESSSFIRTTVEQDTAEKCFSSVSEGGAAILNVLNLSGRSLHHCTSQEREKLMLCAALSNPEGQRGPWQNIRHWLACIAGSQPEGKGAADPFSLLCQHRNFEFDTSSRREMHALALSVRSCMCEKQMKGGLSYRAEMQWQRAGWQGKLLFWW